VTFRKNQFRRALVNWYRRHRRDLPWRKTRDPYRILISEFMLQQTQVATVVRYYKDWLRRFPSFTALASAKQNDVLHAWQGLGYYARARNLHVAAKLVADRHRGHFPRSIEQMQRLPGVGRYTAHAVASFAFDEPVPIIEANTARVLSRVFNLRSPIDSTHGKECLWQNAAVLVPKERAGIYNSALLDLGAVVCLPRAPKCTICPVKKFCRAKNPESLPIKRPPPATKRLVEKHAFIFHNNRLLLTKSITRWREMWILPALNQCSKQDRAVYKAVFPFTNHRVTLQVFLKNKRKIDNGAGGSRATWTGKRASVDEPGGESINRHQRWFSRQELDSIPIPSPHRRAINLLLN